MTLTDAQRRLLDRLRDANEPVRVDGSTLLVAQNLERKGLVRVGVGGSGVAFTAPWWRTAEALRTCYCPGDCNCHRQGAPYFRSNYCGCKGHVNEGGSR